MLSMEIKIILQHFQAYFLANVGLRRLHTLNSHQHLLATKAFTLNTNSSEKYNWSEEHTLERRLITALEIPWRKQVHPVRGMWLILREEEERCPHADAVYLCVCVPKIAFLLLN